jgi:hypothetical protein
MHSPLAYSKMIFHGVDGNLRLLISLHREDMQAARRVFVFTELVGVRSRRAKVPFGCALLCGAGVT